ncbi:MAG: OmpA family protein [Alphaproteobacteria bacterium]|nr:OmpA family protein [Alphaproteobacteria bacterium]
MVGQYMDDQERALRARIRGASVRRIGDEIVIGMQDDTLFEDDSLSERGRRSLIKLSEVLRRYDRSRVAVNGYSDTAGTPQHGIAVSQRKADAVAAALSWDGVDASRIAAQGLGAQHLRVMTGLNRSESRNRRVEVRIAATPQS